MTRSDGVRIFCLILLGLFSVNPYSFGQVENEVGPGETRVRAEAVSGEPAEPQGETTARDPFWPIDYVPVVRNRGTGTPEQGEGDPHGHVDYSRLSPEEQAIIKSQMTVGGILQQGRKDERTCLAIINAQLVKEGETLTFAAAGKTYDFVVRELTTEKIVLESMQ